jgi:hypothetical protein
VRGRDLQRQHEPDLLQDPLLPPGLRPVALKIPTNAKLKACFQTCGKFIPTGAKVTIYVNGKAIFPKTIGLC